MVFKHYRHPVTPAVDVAAKALRADAEGLTFRVPILVPIGAKTPFGGGPSALSFPSLALKSAVTAWLS